MAGHRVRHAFAGSSRQLRLGPEDGIRRHPDERRLVLLDRGGNKLVDVVNKDTGFCVGVTSPMTDDVWPTRPAKPVVPKGKSRYDNMGDSGIPEKIGKVFVDFEGRVVRTVDMGDAPLTVARVDVKAAREKQRAENRKVRVREIADKSDRAAQAKRDKAAHREKLRSAKQQQKLSRAAQGCTDGADPDKPKRAKVASVSRETCVAFIKAKYGPNVPINDAAIRAARTILRKAGVKE